MVDGAVTVGIKAAELALEMAENLLRERMGEEDEARLVSELIARVESVNRADTSGN